MQREETTGRRSPAPQGPSNEFLARQAAAGGHRSHFWMTRATRRSDDAFPRFCGASPRPPEPAPQSARAIRVLETSFRRPPNRETRVLAPERGGSRHAALEPWGWPPSVYGPGAGTRTGTGAGTATATVYFIHCWSFRRRRRRRAPAQGRTSVTVPVCVPATDHAPPVQMAPPPRWRATGPAGRNRAYRNVRTYPRDDARQCIQHGRHENGTGDRNAQGTGTDTGYRGASGRCRWSGLPGTRLRVGVGMAVDVDVRMPAGDHVRAGPNETGAPLGTVPERGGSTGAPPVSWGLAPDDRPHGCGFRQASRALNAGAARRLRRPPRWHKPRRARAPRPSRTARRGSRARTRRGARAWARRTPSVPRR